MKPSMQLRLSGAILALTATAGFLVEEARESYWDWDQMIEPAYPPIPMRKARIKHRGSKCKNYTIRIAKANTFPTRHVPAVNISYV
jgi:hypothetical protein